MAHGKAAASGNEVDAPTIDAPPQASSEGDAPNGGGNCTDETKRQAYREALILKIAVESAQEVLNSKRGEYRAYLKAAGKKGVDTKAITNMLAMRFEDPDLVLIEERERLKMYDLSGFLPGIRDRLLGRLDIQEPTFKEEEENQVLIAYDHGHLAGRSGHSRDDNPYEPGTQGHVKFVEGWLAGQRAIADEMAPDARPETAKPAATPKEKRNGIKPDTAASVAASIASDETMPGEMPALVH